MILEKNTMWWKKTFVPGMKDELANNRSLKRLTPTRNSRWELRGAGDAESGVQGLWEPVASHFMKWPQKMGNGDLTWCQAFSYMLLSSDLPQP